MSTKKKVNLFREKIEKYFNQMKIGNEPESNSFA